MRSLTKAELEALRQILSEDDDDDDYDDIYKDDDIYEDDDEDEISSIVNLGGGLGMICIVCDDDEIGAELAHHALRTLEQLNK